MARKHKLRKRKNPRSAPYESRKATIACLQMQRGDPKHGRTVVEIDRRKFFRSIVAEKKADGRQPHEFLMLTRAEKLEHVRARLQRLILEFEEIGSGLLLRDLDDDQQAEQLDW